MYSNFKEILKKKNRNFKTLETKNPINPNILFSTASPNEFADQEVIDSKGKLKDSIIKNMGHQMVASNNLSKNKEDSKSIHFLFPKNFFFKAKDFEEHTVFKDGRNENVQFESFRKPPGPVLYINITSNHNMSYSNSDKSDPFFADSTGKGEYKNHKNFDPFFRNIDSISKLSTKDYEQVQPKVKNQSINLSLQTNDKFGNTKRDSSVNLLSDSEHIFNSVDHPKGTEVKMERSESSKTLYFKNV
ncbi:unnamed protein product [Brachionus calyciflorus]|uniref:Uncharacterized protein n=1 Tax=Brachionus calyciflorus TaxID=104777 RepID=A0A814M0V5_9BILA|nr:unnamed protein product [Brachionus calyciflorus]